MVPVCWMVEKSQHSWHVLSFGPLSPVCREVIPAGRTAHYKGTVARIPTPHRIFLRYPIESPTHFSISHRPTVNLTLSPLCSGRRSSDKNQRHFRWKVYAVLITESIGAPEELSPIRFIAKLTGDAAC
jgi:hypothetical protein